MIKTNPDSTSRDFQSNFSLKSPVLVHFFKIDQFNKLNKLNLFQVPTLTVLILDGWK